MKFSALRIGARFRFPGGPLGLVFIKTAADRFEPEWTPYPVVVQALGDGEVELAGTKDLLTGFAVGIRH